MCAARRRVRRVEPKDPACDRASPTAKVFMAVAVERLPQRVKRVVLLAGLQQRVSQPAVGRPVGLARSTLAQQLERLPFVSST
jgi:hypothetical protein